MLKSVVKNKSRKFFSDEGVDRSPREDIVTSTVLGYLDYLTEQSAVTVIRWMLGGVVKIPDGYLKSSVELWPRHASCEPDAIIDLTCEGRAPIRILVEAKWGKNRLTTDQLERQWRVFGQTEADRGTTVHHIAIVEHKSIQDRDAVSAAAPNIQRHLLTWRDIAGNLVHRDKVGDHEPNALAKDIIAALELGAGQRPFNGWSNHGAVVDRPAQPVFFREVPWWSVVPVVVGGPQPFFQSDI